ncbi:MAG: endonuclease/exonuclease/phosphatase family protein [candidate division WOR-3 bacterium]
MVITFGPVRPVLADTVRFRWQGSDVDGRVVGYYYAVDDSTPDNWTDSTEVMLTGLSFGRHSFYVQACDDSQTRSQAAVWPFVVEFDSAVLPAGTDSTLDIATWNIQNFPKLGDSTVSRVRSLVHGLALDLYALQEIEDTIAFRRLLAGLPGYAGLYSQDDYGSYYQKTAVLYREEVVTVSGVEQLFWENDSFPRPPLKMLVTTRHNGRSFDFGLIVLHLKAGSGFSDRARRAGACRTLKAYLDSLMAQGPEQDWIVAGDWNDLLEDPPAENVFRPFLDDTFNYRFLTRPLAGNPYYSSLLSGDGIFDHLLVTRDVLDEYAGGITTTLRLDDRLPEYGAVVSDHRPVMATFPVFTLRH